MILLKTKIFPVVLQEKTQIPSQKTLEEYSNRNLTLCLCLMARVLMGIRLVKKEYFSVPGRSSAVSFSIFDAHSIFFSFSVSLRFYLQQYSA